MAGAADARSCRARWFVLLAVVSSVLAACTSSHRSAARPSHTTAAPSAASQCVQLTDVEAITQCLRRSVADFWTTELRRHVDEPVHLRAQAAQVPATCRVGLTAAPAFTCRANQQLYLNASLLDTISSRIPAAERPYAFAVVQSHEIGHVVQQLLRQPQAVPTTPSTAQIRFVEQQADCLSGVWAFHEAADGRLNVIEFGRAVQHTLTLLNTRTEQRTHGTTAQRIAAVERGLRRGDPKDCALVTFT